MERMIVTLKRADKDVTRDLELPADVPMAQLVPMLLQALRWPLNPGAPLGGYGIEARPPGRTLSGDETLAQAGVWDGACLTLHPDPSVADGARFGTPAAGVQPGWRRVDLPAQQELEPSQDRPQGPSKGFAWKQLDED
jgi:hypothetical protein